MSTSAHKTQPCEQFAHLITVIDSHPSTGAATSAWPASSVWHVFVSADSAEQVEISRRGEASYARIDAAHRQPATPWLQACWREDVGWHRPVPVFAAEPIRQRPALVNSTATTVNDKTLQHRLAEAAHDVRAPIAVAQQCLIALAHRVSAGTPLNSGDIDLLRSAQVRLSQATQWANSILLGRRLEQGQQSSQRLRFYPHQWRIDQQPLLEALAARHEVELVWSGWDRSLPRLYLDPVHLSRAVLNLVTNAIEASLPGGRVKIAVSWLTDVTQQLVLSIEDQGGGLPAEQLRRINSPQLWPSSAGQPEPSGLGLRTAKALIYGLGGTLTARNPATGGAELSLSLPVDNYHSLVRSWLLQNLTAQPANQDRTSYQVTFHALRAPQLSAEVTSQRRQQLLAKMDEQLQRAASPRDFVYRVSHDRWLWLALNTMVTHSQIGPQRKPLPALPPALAKVLRGHRALNMDSVQGWRQQCVYRSEPIVLRQDLHASGTQRSLGHLTAVLAEMLAELNGNRVPPIDVLSAGPLPQPLANNVPLMQRRLDQPQTALVRGGSRTTSGILADTPEESFSGTLAELSRQWHATQRRLARMHRMPHA